ncbi:MAG TPA: FAD-binding oxidoreductase [Longimicrobiaceae bacterium]|nr:FAD-binding oxidoreductase [Longimicrobiaceae bacterium]
MRRWNGWGDETVRVPLPAPAARMLEERLGPGTPPLDATLADLVAEVSASDLPPHPLITAEPVDRVRHARGQSLPDWIALRSGCIGRVPDGVAYPASEAEVRDLLRYAAEVEARLIPYGGGTSVAGHLTPPAGEQPVLTVDLSRMHRLRRLDETSRLATFGAGVRGPDLEAELRARGYTLGHFPQSWELSTLGGWVATRSSGQQSLGYGRIEQLFAGGRLEAPDGTLELPPFPASAAGPDVRELVLGSEGRLGVITEATVRVRPVPQEERFDAVLLPDRERGYAAARSIAQAELPLSMVRLLGPEETSVTLMLAGRERLPGVVEWLLSWRGIGEERCLLLLGVSGSGSTHSAARREALALALDAGCVQLGRSPGRHWKRNRFRSAYLRNTLWEAGYAVDTVETAARWSRIPRLVNSVEEALRSGLGGEEERVFAFSHLSHLYPTGSSVYVTYLYRIARDPEETLGRWQLLKAAATRAIQEQGGTLSHQHGVGVDHRPYLETEKGAMGIAALRALCAAFDPAAIMNPDKLLPQEEECGTLAGAIGSGRG